MGFLEQAEVRFTPARRDDLALKLHEWLDGPAFRVQNVGVVDFASPYEGEVMWMPIPTGPSPSVGWIAGCDLTFVQAPVSE